MRRTSLTAACAVASLLLSSVALAQEEAKPARNEPTGELPGAAKELPKESMEAIAEQVDTPYRPKPGGHLVKFNLEDADLAELVNHISGLTGRRFIYGAKVRQIKVTVVSPDAVTLNEAYEAFLSILDANGMTVVPHGRFLKIVDASGIVSRDTPIYSRGAPVPDTDRMVTRLYRLKHVVPSEVAKVLTKFKSKDGDVSTYDEGQLLIMTDTGTQVRRMIRLIEEMDLGGVSSRMWIEPVHYGSAVDLAKQLNEIYDLSKKQGGTGSGLERVIAEEMTNSLIIVGTEDSYLNLLELLKRIDVAPSAEGRIQVLPLQNADAEELSKTLTRLVGTGGRKKEQSGQPAQTAEVFEGEILVTADKATNSLIISSSAHDLAQLRLVIEKLDKKRRQVFIEAVIMDVGVDRSKNLNLAYHAGIPDAVGEGSLALGGFEASKTVLPGLDSLQGAALGAFGPQTEVNLGPNVGLSIPAFGVLVNALASSGDSNVLSTPHIIALDNTEAEISIGENIPLQTNIAGGGMPNLGALAGAAGGQNNLGALGALGGLGFGGFNAQRAEVGTKVKIVPHINEENQVRLELEEEISNPGAPTGQLGAVPITKRTAKTTVVVDDQQTVVIGGLMRDDKTQNATKIPILGDLPVLGFLFRSSGEKLRKTNLLLILTPHVIRDQEDLRQVFERKMQERQQFLDRFFVFTSDWEPPRDYTRTSGLVEEVRKAFFEIEERQRLEEEGAPKEEKFHEASEPLELSADVGQGGSTRKASKPAERKKTRAKRTTRKKRSELGEPLRIQPFARTLNVDASETSSIPGPPAALEEEPTVSN
jgi:general secretion pathway protein D